VATLPEFPTDVFFFTLSLHPSNLLFSDKKICNPIPIPIPNISNYLKTCSISFPGGECLSLHFEFPSAGVEGQQLQQQSVQSPQRPVANALVVQSLANALGKCQFVVNMCVYIYMYIHVYSPYLLLLSTSPLPIFLFVLRWK